MGDRIVRYDYVDEVEEEDDDDEDEVEEGSRDPGDADGRHGICPKIYTAGF